MKNRPRGKRGRVARLGSRDGIPTMSRNEVTGERSIGATPRPADRSPVSFAETHHHARGLNDCPAWCATDADGRDAAERALDDGATICFRCAVTSERDLSHATIVTAPRNRVACGDGDSDSSGANGDGCR